MKLALISCVITALAALSLNAEAARFVRFEVNGTTSYGEVVGEKIHQLSGLYFNAPERTGVTYDYDAVKLLLPLAPRDVSKILGTAVNTKRPNLSLPENPHPRWFAKFPSSLNPNGAGVMLPPEPGYLNDGGELVAVIGKTARHVREEDALNYVFGYAARKDFSVITWHGQ